MSRTSTFTLRSVAGSARAVFLTAGILLSLPSAAWAQSPLPTHGPCRVAILHGQHVQPSPECHLPPPLPQNPASLENTTPAEREEIDRLAKYLLRRSATSAEPKRPVDRPAEPSVGDRRSQQVGPAQ